MSSSQLKPLTSPNPFTPQAQQNNMLYTQPGALQPIERPIPRPTPTPPPLPQPFQQTQLYEQGPIFEYIPSPPQPTYPTPETDIGERIMTSKQIQQFIKIMNQLIGTEQINKQTSALYAPTEPTPEQKQQLRSEEFRVKTEEEITRGNIGAIITGRIAPQVYQFPLTLWTAATGLILGKPQIEIAKNIQAQTYEAERRMGELFYKPNMGPIDYLTGVGVWTWESAVGQAGFMELGGEVVGGLAKIPMTKIAPKIVSKVGEVAEGAGIASKIAGGVKTVGQTIVSHPREVEAVGLAALGGIEAYKAYQMNIYGMPIERIGASITQDVVDVSMFGFGLGEGLKKGIPGIRELEFAGKEEVLVESIVEPKVVAGQEPFPTTKGGPEQIVREFRSPEYKLPETAGVGGFHTTAEPPSVRDLTVGKGFVVEVGKTKGAVGLHVSPSMSPYFLRLGGEAEVGLPSRLITGMEQPKILYFTAEDVARMPSSIIGKMKVTGSPKAGIEYLMEDIPKEYFYISPAVELGKTEKEALIAPKAFAKFEGFKEYTKWAGVKVPIERYAIGGEGATVDLKSLVGTSLPSSYVSAKGSGIGFLVGLGLVSTPSVSRVASSSIAPTLVTSGISKADVSSVVGEPSSYVPTVSRVSMPSYPSITYVPSTVRPPSIPSPPPSTLSIPSRPSLPSIPSIVTPSSTPPYTPPYGPVIWGMPSKKKREKRDKPFFRSLLWEWKMRNPFKEMKILSEGIIGRPFKIKSKRGKKKG